MKKNVITAILLIPLLAWAQYDIPTLSSVVRVDAFVPMPTLSEDTLLKGDVAGVVCLFETPNVIKTYPWSCFEKKHRIQDVITNERWEYEYDTTGNLQRMHCQYTMRADTGVLLQWHDAVPRNDCIYVQYEYNHQGNVEKISFKQLDESSNVRSCSIAYRYLYDDLGNWIRREIYYNGKKLGVDKREITYSR